MKTVFTGCHTLIWILFFITSFFLVFPVRPKASQSLQTQVCGGFCICAWHYLCSTLQKVYISMYVYQIRICTRKIIHETNLSKLEKWPWVPSEVFNVKHSLRVWKIREIYSKPRIYSISGAKVWYSTWNGHLRKQHTSILA